MSSPFVISLESWNSGYWSTGFLKKDSKKILQEYQGVTLSFFYTVLAVLILQGPPDDRIAYYNRGRLVKRQQTISPGISRSYRILANLLFSLAILAVAFLSENRDYNDMMQTKDTTSMKLSDSDFRNLPRWSNGRLMDLADVFYMLTEEQVAQLHGDDWSYYQDLQEELEYEYSFYR
jgi:hypothetical protein